MGVSALSTVLAARVDELRFVIDFLSPFRVSTGEAAAGVDVTIDPGAPLPAASLKGVMRATARQLLGEPAPLVGEIFGDAEWPCPWHWGDAVPVPGPGTTRAEFVLTRMEPVADAGLHAAVLAIAARAIRSLGADRRRGLGWVSISCPDVILDRAIVEAVLSRSCLGGPHE